jgi:hypothetical protein
MEKDLRFIISVSTRNKWQYYVKAPCGLQILLSEDNQTYFSGHSKSDI